MPQKACEGGIFHVRAMHIFPEMPQNRTYSFYAPLNAPFKCPIFPSDSENGKNGAFQEKRTEKSGAFREKST